MTAAVRVLPTPRPQMGPLPSLVFGFVTGCALLALLAGAVLIAKKLRA